MSLFGAGRRTATVLASVLVLAGANQSSASSREDAKRESASATHKSAPAAVHQPSTESIGRINPYESDNTPRVAPYETFSGVTEPSRDEKLLVELINVERKSQGLKPVVWDGMLSGIARMHSGDQRSMHRTSHNSSNDGATYSQRLARTPFRASAAAENVAYNSNVMRAHRALMASPPHRRNILDPMLTAVGIGVVVDKDQWVYVTEDFATATASVSDNEAKRVMGTSIEKAHSKIFRLEEDKAVSRALDKLVNEMIESGSVKNAVGNTVGVGWTLAFTALDPQQIPKAALERAAKAQGYGLAVQFRKTKKYPFGAYWAILFLKGEY